MGRPPSQVTVGIRFADFDGAAVYHCDVLDHDDQGNDGARRRAVNLGISPLDGCTFPSVKEADQMSPPPGSAAGHEGGTASGDVRTARLLVAGQFVLIGIIVVLPNGDDWPVPTALSVACTAATVLGLTVMVIGATGLGRGLAATPLPNAHAQLRTGGLYRYVRHPIYSGLLLMMASITVAAGSGLRLLTLAALVLLLNVKARWEETRLAQRFEGYADYAARTPRFVPFRLRRSP